MHIGVSMTNLVSVHKSLVLKIPQILRGSNMKILKTEDFALVNVDFSNPRGKSMRNHQRFGYQT